MRATYRRTVTGRDTILDVAPAPARSPSWYRSTLQAARVHRIATGLYLGLVVLNLIDLVTTRLVLDRGGREGNPVMQPIIHTPLGALAAKALCLGLIGLLIVRSRRSPRMLVVLASVDVWYVLVVLWNLQVLHALT